jgi:hypothetical protein
MARQKNDGRGRLGGRAKGTPNKPALSVQEWAAGMLNGNRRKFEQAMKDNDSDNVLVAYAVLSLAEAVRAQTEVLKTVAV